MGVAIPVLKALLYQYNCIHSGIVQAVQLFSVDKLKGFDPVTAKCLQFLLTLMRDENAQHLAGLGS